MPSHQLWPHEWLQSDFPGARVLSYEYHAPMGYRWFTGQEADLMPSLEEMGREMARKLQLAGEGSR